MSKFIFDTPDSPDSKADKAYVEQEIPGYTEVASEGTVETLTPVIKAHPDAPVFVGRTVLYHLDGANHFTVNRAFGKHSFTGLEIPVGGVHEVGQPLPMIVTAVNGDGTINGQVLLDGNQSLWVKGAHYGQGEGRWEEV